MDEVPITLILSSKFALLLPLCWNSHPTSSKDVHWIISRQRDSPMCNIWLLLLFQCFLRFNVHYIFERPTIRVTKRVIYKRCYGLDERYISIKLSAHDSQRLWEYRWDRVGNLNTTGEISQATSKEDVEKVSPSELITRSLTQKSATKCCFQMIPRIALTLSGTFLVPYLFGLYSLPQCVNFRFDSVRRLTRNVPVWRYLQLGW